MGRTFSIEQLEHDTTFHANTRKHIHMKATDSLLPDDEAGRDAVDGLDEVHAVPAIREQVVDVHVLDVQAVDPHAEHALLSA